MKKEAVKKEESKEKLFGLNAVILFGIFLIMGIVFYVSLNIVKSGNNLGTTSGGVALSPETKNNFGFGLEEIIFSVVFGLFMTGFLLWIKSTIIKNAYLGVIMGISGSVILGYAFYLKYKGHYSTGFMIAAGFVIIVYLGMNFYRYRKEDYGKEEE